ncbi:hypothetical protein U1701_18520, partial [Sphingomonas sp. PB2P19]
QSATSRLPKPKINIMLPQTTSIWLRDSQPNASGRPGAVQTLQKFASVHANVHNHFNPERHLVDRQTYKERRSAALAKCRVLTS